MNKWLLLSLGFVFMQSCAQQDWYGKLEFQGRFPNKLSEVSGIAVYEDHKAWVIEDNGNKDHIYEVGLDGMLIRDLEVKNAKNTDWEDLTRDASGHLYIGDFGNNANQRTDLVIYKLPDPTTEKGKKIKAQKIAFSYPEQQKFPPKKSDMLYDTEGFFHHGDFLYIFTKNRTRPYNGKTLVYRVPDSPGTYEAVLLDTLVLCTEKDHCSVTAAAISPSGSTIALLGYGYVYLIRDFSFDTIAKGTIDTVYFKYETQIESVCFLDEQTLLLADEQSKTKGRNLYTYRLD